MFAVDRSTLDIAYFEDAVPHYGFNMAYLDKILLNLTSAEDRLPHYRPITDHPSAHAVRNSIEKRMIIGNFPRKFVNRKAMWRGSVQRYTVERNCFVGGPNKSLLSTVRWPDYDNRVSNMDNAKLMVSIEVEILEMYQPAVKTKVARILVETKYDDEEHPRLMQLRVDNFHLPDNYVMSLPPKNVYRWQILMYHTNGHIYIFDVMYTDMGPKYTSRMDIGTLTPSMDDQIFDRCSHELARYYRLMYTLRPVDERFKFSTYVWKRLVHIPNLNIKINRPIDGLFQLQMFFEMLVLEALAREHKLNLPTDDYNMVVFFTRRWEVIDSEKYRIFLSGTLEQPKIIMIKGEGFDPIPININIYGDKRAPIANS